MDKKDTMINDLTTGSVPKQLIIFATPLLLSGFLQTAYNMVDMVIVGNYVNKSGLAAVSIGADVLHLLTFIAMGFSSAGQVIISQYVGAGRHEQISKLIGTLFTFLLSCALIMTVGCLAFTDNILRWVNTSEDAFDYAHSYVFVCILGLFFIYGYNLVSAILRGMGDSKHPFIFIATAAILNIILDYLFVAKLNMATLGAALATVIGQGVSFIWALCFLYRRRDQFGFDFKPKSFRIDKEVFPPLIKLGIPMVLQSAAVSLSKLYVNSWVNSYGSVATAVTGVGNKLSTITNVFAQSLSTAGSSMMAQCIGAEKYDRVPRVLGTSFILNGVVSAMLSIAMYFFPTAIFGIFTDDPEVLAMSVIYVPVALLLYLSCIFRPPMFALISASGNSRLNLVIALLDGVIARIGFALLLGVTFDLGIKGFWYGDALAGFIPAIVGAIYYRSGKWKTRKYIIKD